MLGKLKNLIFNNIFLISALFLTTLFLYFSFNNIYFFPLFFITLIFYNFYYFKSLEIFIASFLPPLLLLSLISIFSLQAFYILILWPTCYLILIKFNKLGWIIILFLLIYILNNLFQTFSLFLISFLFSLLTFLILFFGYKENFIESLTKTAFSLEAFWILYFTPFGIKERTIINFLFLIWILNKKLL